MALQRLFKRDSKGAVRQWEVFTEDDTMVVVHGLRGGKLQEKRTKCKPKNIGKSNETTPTQQARIESAAAHKKQMDRECYTYHEDDDRPYVQPMLARDATKVPKQIKWHDATKAYYGQAKLDGCRVMFVDGQLQSRKGTIYTAPKHLIPELQKLADLLQPDAFLDGEIYYMGLPLNQIMSAVKKENENTAKLEFHLFDVAVKNQQYHHRRIMTEMLLPEDTQFVKRVCSFNLQEDYLKQQHDRMVQNGYEGLMIRDAEGLYGFGERSDSLYKYKEFLEEEFLITGIVADKYGGGTLQCVVPGKGSFSCRHRGTNSFRALLLEHKHRYIGKQLTVRFFDYTEFGIPQFPVGVVIL